MKKSMEWVASDPEIIDLGSSNTTDQIIINQIEGGFYVDVNGFQYTLYEKEEEKMPDFIDNIKLISDLNEDGTVDISDFKVGFKYFSIIYLGLMSLLFTILGEDLESLKDNIYFMIIFAIIAIVITILFVVMRKKFNKKDKEIMKLKGVITDQTTILYKNELKDIEKDHAHELEKIDLEFQIKIKDKLVQEKI